MYIKKIYMDCLWRKQLESQCLDPKGTQTYPQPHSQHYCLAIDFKIEYIFLLTHSTLKGLKKYQKNYFSCLDFCNKL